MIYHLVNDNAETALQKIKLIEDKVVKFQIIEEYVGKLIAARPDMLLDILVQEIRSFKHLSILPSLLGTPDSYVATVIDYLVCYSILAKWPHLKTETSYQNQKPNSLIHLQFARLLSDQREIEPESSRGVFRRTGRDFLPKRSS